MAEEFTRKQLEEFRPEFAFFAGIDSDGCLFPTMDIKQKQCFHPAIMDHWGLHGIEKYLREAAEFVNLYSKGRGRNRFLCLLDTMDLLRDRPEVIDSGAVIPEFASLKQWISEESLLGNPTLEKKVAETGDPELIKLLEWSLDVNERVAKKVHHLPPFEWAVKALEMMSGTVDTVCVSQTPTEALVREWEESGIRQYVEIIAGQELGTKTEHLALAAGGKYGSSHILMIGDAPGDLKAAKDNDALFYPIMPDREEESWQRFCEESFGKFLDGTYAGDYEVCLIHGFDKSLPEKPPWKG